MSEKKMVTDLDVTGKKVLVRVDFNVPIKEGKIKDDDKKKLEDEIKKSKDILAKTDALKDDLDKARESLSTILQTVGAAMYQNQPGQDGQTPPQDESKKEDKKQDKKDDNKSAEEGEVVE